VRPGVTVTVPSDFNRYCHGDRGRRRQPVGSLSHLVVLTVTRLSAPATSTFNLKFNLASSESGQHSVPVPACQSR
jgi:hypothetical protein